MPEVHLTFVDGEVIRAETDLIDFGQPVVKALALDGDSNNEELTIPLSSLKYIVMSGSEAPSETDAMTKMVIHFTDHEVLRAYADREVLGGPYGVIYTLVEPKGKVRRRIGVPYTAVKAIFKVKDWNGKATTKVAAKKTAPRNAVGAKTVVRKAAPKRPSAKKAAR